MRLSRIKKSKRTRKFPKLREGKYLLCFGKNIHLATYDKQRDALLDGNGYSWDMESRKITDLYIIDDDRKFDE